MSEQDWILNIDIAMMPYNFYNLIKYTKLILLINKDLNCFLKIDFTFQTYFWHHPLSEMYLKKKFKFEKVWHALSGVTTITVLRYILTFILLLIQNFLILLNKVETWLA